MPEIRNPNAIAERLRAQASCDDLRLTLHAHREMVAENISYESVRHALTGCEVLENYPDHQRGACCLVNGHDGAGRYIHVVCTTSLDVVIIITVYEPQPPKWVTPLERETRL